jgi:hypothetical protein
MSASGRGYGGDPSRADSTSRGRLAPRLLNEAPPNTMLESISASGFLNAHRKMRAQMEGDDVIYIDLYRSRAAATALLMR